MTAPSFLKKILTITGVCILQVHFALAQNAVGEKIIRFTSDYTSFPDSARANGHIYDSVLYPAKDHYSDNSVVLIIPKNLNAKRTVDLVFWFHGWHNNIDTALQFYEIKKQFLESK